MKAESPENPAEAVTPEEAIERRALARAQEEAREARRAARRAEVEASAAYTLIRQIARWTDRWHIDPLIGLVLPGAGDALSAFCALPYLYVSIAKVRSLPLTLAVLANTLLDLAEKGNRELQAAQRAALALD